MKAIVVERMTVVMVNASWKWIRSWKIFDVVSVELVGVSQTWLRYLDCGLRPERCCLVESSRVLWKGYFVVLEL